MGEELLNAFDGNGEAYSGGILADGLVDADEFAVKIDERATGIARIDRRVRLEDVVEWISLVFVAAVDGGQNALRNGMLKTERIADGDDAFAEHDVVRQRERRRLEVLWNRSAGHADEAKVVRSVKSNQFAFEGRPVPQTDFDIVGAFHDMQIRQHKTTWIDDDAAAQWIVFLHDLLLHAAKTEEIEIREEVVITIIDFHKCFRSNVYNPWKGVCHGLHDGCGAIAERLFLRDAEAGGHGNQDGKKVMFHGMIGCSEWKMTDMEKIQSSLGDFFYI